MKMKLKWNTVLVTVCCIILTGLTACGTSQTKDAGSKATASSSSGQTSPPVKEQWQKDWESMIEQAKKEGEVVIVGQPPTNREQIAKEFEKQYPGIKVKYTGMRPSEMTPKLLAEQKQGKYLTDILMEAGQSIKTDFLPNKASEDIRNYIVLPELKEDKLWQNGYEAGFKMADNVGSFVFAVMAVPSAFINNDLIPEGQIKTLNDLLDPKWKGKIIMQDFSRPAQGNTTVTSLWMEQGEDYVKKLLEQQPMVIDDLRQAVEFFATGKYPIGIGLDTTTLRKFVDDGVLKKVDRIHPEKTTTLHGLTLNVLTNPPHPNATKVFVNWFLGKDAQSQFVKLTGEYISRRTDVPPSPDKDTRGWDKIDYKKSLLDQEALDVRKKVMDLGKTMKK